MIAKKVQPELFKNWNARWKAPAGPESAQGMSFESKLARAEEVGRFAFQRNNSIREAEYPWCFYNTGPHAGQEVLEVGGALSGFQFVLDHVGAKVTNVDPILPYGPETEEECVGADDRHSRLNDAFGSSVRLIRKTLTGAGLESDRFDAAYCISTIEHLEPDELEETVKELRRVLKPGGLLAVTMDLFIDAEPFVVGKQSTKWGRNFSVKKIVEWSGMKLTEGREGELFGYPNFSPNDVMWDLRKQLIGRDYPCLTMMFVLQKA